MTIEQQDLCAAVHECIEVHRGQPLDDVKRVDFWIPAAWHARGEQYGLSSVLIVVHDGGPLAPFFNPAYGDAPALRAMRKALEACASPEAPRGYWSEPCTAWYTAIYRNP